MKIDENLGFVYIEEQTSPEGFAPKNFDVHKDNGVEFASFETCMHSFDVMNRNSRMYRASNIEKCLQTERIQSYLSHGGWFGEMNHPISHYKDKPLSPERIRDIDMNNTSHKFLNPHIERNLLVSKVETDSGTEAGMNMMRKMIQGFTPAFSCRAIATLQLESGKPVVDVHQVITYDWVLFQSHREAEQLTERGTKFVNKIANTAKEVVENAKDILIPLKEILENVGKTDVTTQVVMEAFDLDLNSMVGFSENKRHVILKDSNNVVYCNIQPETRKKVNDFFRSYGN